MPEARNREIELLGNSVEYQVRYSPDASEPRIDVDIHGVKVVIPSDGDVQPSELLRENAAWVVDKQRGYDKYREQAPDRQFEPGERFPVLGEEYELVVESRQKHSLTDDEIRLRQSTVEQSSVEQVLESFYRNRAREHFTDRADHFAERMNVEYENLELRNQRTRWGSCSTEGTLSLNWRLIMAPPEVVDYLIIHELAHLSEQHHGREFWQFVGEYDPEYKKHAEWLDQNSAKLIFTRDDL